MEITRLDRDKEGRRRESRRNGKRGRTSEANSRGIEKESRRSESGTKRKRQGCRENKNEREDEEKEVYQLAESSLPDWLASPCLFFAVRFILFYSQALNTRTRPLVGTYRSGCFVESSRMTSSIDKSTQVSSGCLAKSPFVPSPL